MKYHPDTFSSNTNIKGILNIYVLENQFCSYDVFVLSKLIFIESQILSETLYYPTHTFEPKANGLNRTLSVMFVYVPRHSCALFRKSAHKS